MAVDQALLESAGVTGQTTLRFYGWESPTLSLGYFQKLASRREHPESLACPVVRRASGGGAIVHDQELTFSLAMPDANRWSARHNDLYRTVHRSIIRWLRNHGILADEYEKGMKDAEAKGDRSIDSSSANRFLCFERRTDGDIVLEGRKIGGSAQRRNGDAVLQHTSLLVRTSLSAPQLPGIEELVGIKMEEERMRAGLVDEIADCLRFKLVQAEMDSNVRSEATSIAAEKFANPNWILRR